MLKKQIVLKELHELNLEGCCEELKDLIKSNIKIIETDVCEFYRDEIVKCSGMLLNLLEIPTELKNDAVVSHIEELTQALEEYHQIINDIERRCPDGEN
jgi:hypothetical protein